MFGIPSLLLDASWNVFLLRSFGVFIAAAVVVRTCETFAALLQLLLRSKMFLEAEVEDFANVLDGLDFDRL